MSEASLKQELDAIVEFYSHPTKEERDLQAFKLEFTDTQATSWERTQRNDRIAKKDKMSKAQCRQWDKLFMLADAVCEQIDEENMEFFADRPALYLGLKEEIKILNKKKKQSNLKELCEELADEAAREVLNQ